MRRPIRSAHRDGTTTVEAAFVLPVFFFFVFALIEFSHAQLVNHLLSSACRNGARVGAVEGTSTEQVIGRVQQTLGSAINTSTVAIYVKDASVYDSGGAPPTTGLGIQALPDLNVADAEPRQMFVVRATVQYNNIALVPMPFMNGVTLQSQSFMRHE